MNNTQIAIEINEHLLRCNLSFTEKQLSGIHHAAIILYQKSFVEGYEECIKDVEQKINELKI